MVEWDTGETQRKGKNRHAHIPGATLSGKGRRGDWCRPADRRRGTAVIKEALRGGVHKGDAEKQQTMTRSRNSCSKKDQPHRHPHESVRKGVLSSEHRPRFPGAHATCLTQGEEQRGRTHRLSCCRHCAALPARSPWLPSSLLIPLFPWAFSFGRKVNDYRFLFVIKCM